MASPEFDGYRLVTTGMYTGIDRRTLGLLIEGLRSDLRFVQSNDANTVVCGSVRVLTAHLELSGDTREVPVELPTHLRAIVREQAIHNLNAKIRAAEHALANLS